MAITKVPASPSSKLRVNKAVWVKLASGWLLAVLVVCTVIHVAINRDKTFEIFEMSSLFGGGYIIVIVVSRTVIVALLISSLGGSNMVASGGVSGALGGVDDWLEGDVVFKISGSLKNIWFEGNCPRLQIAF